MKVFTIILFLSMFSLELRSQVLDIPKTIDLGEIDIFTCFENNSDLIISKDFTIKNPSKDKTILFTEPFFYFTYNLPDSIINAYKFHGKFGRILLFGSSWGIISNRYKNSFFHLDAGDSLNLTFSLQAYYNEINFPKDIKEISANLILQYRIPDSTSFKYDTILVKFKPTRKKEIFLYSFMYGNNWIFYDINDKPFIGNSQSILRNMYNTSSPFYVDSVFSFSSDCQVSLDTIFGITDSKKFPLLINNNGLNAQFEFSTRNLKTNQSNILKFNYFCRNQNNDSVFSIFDSCKISIYYYPKVHIWWRNNYLQSNIGKTDTCLATIETCSNDTYYVDSVTFVSDTSWLPKEMNFYCTWSNFPLELDPKLGFWENPIVFSPLSTYNKLGYAVFYIRGNKNDFFKRYVLLRTIGQEVNAIQENDATNLISIYPNPTNDYIIVSGLDEDSQAVVILYNICGSKVFEKIINNKEAINVEHLEAGIYFLICESNSKYYLSKIIISR
jgi:hypothetical protein